jgi:hypothetical protein
MAALARLLIAGDQDSVWAKLAARYAADDTDADALFDMAMLLRLSGRIEESARLQAGALALKACFTCQHGRGEGLSVLVLVTGGDVMSNAPIDFLCEDADVTLHFAHLDAPAPIVAPPHDLAFIAVGLSDTNRPALERLSQVLSSHWSGPVMNGAPQRVLAMTREAAYDLFHDCPGVVAPPNLKVQRDRVEAFAAGERAPSDLGPDFAYPLLIRPPNTHGGKGLERIDDAANWRGYLDRHPDDAFYLAPFVDYQDTDGYFPKLRIAFIDGRPFAVHMALSDHWLAHYISAGMLEAPEKRVREAAWMADFEHDFAVRHADALGAIAERFGVDYFSIDCAETADGRLLLFEADVASIIHALDPVEVFPYKRVAMDRLFAAFQAALRRRVGAVAVEDAA